MVKSMLAFLILLVPASSFAQGGGHVGIFHRNRQQQQQQASTFTFYTVIKGSEARAIYEEFLFKPELKEADLSATCSQHVKTISGTLHGKSFECFDRGEAFEGSRYKCYRSKEVSLRFFTSALHWFNRQPKACGGDGIEPVVRE